MCVPHYSKNIIITIDLWSIQFPTCWSPMIVPTEPAGHRMIRGDSQALKSVKRERISYSYKVK